MWVRPEIAVSIHGVLSTLSLLEHTNVVVTFFTARHWLSDIGHRPPDIHQIEPVTRELRRHVFQTSGDRFFQLRVTLSFLSPLRLHLAGPSV